MFASDVTVTNARVLFVCELRCIGPIRLTCMASAMPLVMDCKTLFGQVGHLAKSSVK